MTWHVGTETLRAYAEGVLGGAAAMSVESHLPTCDTCRDALPVDEARMDRMWSGIRVDAARSRPGLVERVLEALGVPAHVARLLSATPSLSASWLLAVAVALGFAVGAAHTGAGGRALFITVAPLVPLLGVAAAYGPGVDPTYEVGIATPTRALRLLLVRAVAVLSVSIALLAVASAFLPAGMGALLWLVPSLALVSLGLAARSVVPLPLAGIALAVAWIGASVGAATWTDDVLRVARADVQVILGTVSLAAAWTTWVRRDRVEGGR